MKPLLSVCCITYNHQNFIRDCLQGFLKQKTKFSVEFIVHDDASIDKTQEIIKKTVGSDQRFKLILRTENIKSKGVPVFPLTYKLAQGKYIATCEGDDYWTDPYKLQKQVDFLEANPHYSGAFHETETTYEYEGGKPKVFGLNAPKIVTVEDTISSLSVFHTSSFMFRNQISEFPSWMLKIKSFDMALFSLVAAYGPIKKIEGRMSVYRKHIDGITNTQGHMNNFHKDRIQLIQYLDEFHDFKFHGKAKEIMKLHEVEFRRKSKSIQDDNISSINKLKNFLKKIISK